MEFTEDIKLINQRLIDLYGKDVILNLPKFRVVWSEYTEKRYGQFARFTEEGIYLRTESGVFEEPKYQGLCTEKWVLEELCPTNGNPYLQMVTPYSYEPVWVFGAANSNPIPLWRAVKLLVEIRLKGDPNNQLKAPSDYLKADNDRMAAEKSRNKDILKDESPLIPSQIHDGEGIVVPTNYERQDDGNSKSV
jgi:hypothetical protein